MVDTHSLRHASCRSVHDPGAGPAGDQRCDRQAEFVDHAGVGQLPVERRASLGEHHAGAAAVELGQDFGRPGPRRRQLHHLGHGPESLHGLRRRRAPGEDHRGVFALPPIGEQREAQIEVEAGGDHRQPGPLGAPRGQPGPAGGCPGSRQAVALGPHRAGGGDDPVCAGPHRREDGLVGGVAECFAGAVDGDGTVGRGDHVDHQPGPPGRLGPRQRRVELHRVDVDGRAGQQSPHAREGTAGVPVARFSTGSLRISGRREQPCTAIPRSCARVHRHLVLGSRRARGGVPGRISGG